MWNLAVHENKRFSIKSFLSRTLTTHRTAGERRGLFFISLYHFHPLTNIQTLNCSFCRRDDYHMFLIAPLVFTRLLLDEILPPYRITIWLIDDVKFVLVCLLDDLILGFFYSNFDTGGLEIASTITLVLQGNRLTKCASVQILPGFKNWDIQDLTLRRCDTLKSCRWNFFKFCCVVHFRKIYKNQV